MFGGALFVSTLCLLAFYFSRRRRCGLVVVAYMLHGFFYGITIPLLWAMIADVADYSEWKNHRRATAIVFSAMLCGLKIGLAIGGALVAAILAYYGYDAGARRPVRRASCAASSLAVSVYSSIPFLLGVGLLFFYEIDKRMESRIEPSSAHAEPGLPEPTDVDRKSSMSDEYDPAELKALAAKAISPPLVTHIYTADPSAHVFEGKIYIYPSHDIDAGMPFDDEGDHFGMEDYHVFRMDTPERRPSTAAWPCTCATCLGPSGRCGRRTRPARTARYYLYFPAKRADGMFQIGVAVGERPAGPFKPEPQAIEGSYSIDPAVLADDDGVHYMYFGGIWGGQLQKYRDKSIRSSNHEPPPTSAALGPRMARLRDDMKRFAEAPREIIILDADGPTAARRRPCAPLLRRPVDAQVPGPLLPVLFHRRHAFPVLRDRRQSLRAVHLSGPDPDAGGRLDHASFDRRVRQPAGACSTTTRCCPAA